MKRLRLFLLVGTLLSGFIATQDANAQVSSGIVVSACGAAGPYTAGQPAPLTVDTHGNQCGTASGGSGGGPYVFTSTGFQQVASFSTATGFTPPAGSTICFIQAETNAVRYRTDGTNPTASVGELLPASSATVSNQLALTASLSTVKFIPVTGSATLNVDCYK